MRRADHATGTLRLGLGLLWILDGLLQAQPALFDGGMVHGVLDAAAAGQPPWLGGLILTAAHLWAAAPVGFNAVAAVLQVVLGLGILGARRRAYPWVLGVSVAWSAAVWVVGEGLGGLLLPGAALISGAPGAALLYALVGALLLAQALGADLDLGRAATLAVGGYFALGLVLQVLPSAPGPAALANLVLANARVPQPPVLAAALTMAAAWAGLPGAPALLAAASAALAALWWTRGGDRHLVTATALVLLALWWFGMDFGVLGGLGTDPNTPPLVALLMVAARRPLPVHRVAYGMPATLGSGSRTR